MDYITSEPQPAYRPSKMTHHRRRAILKALENGNSRSCAAELNGITRETMRRWIATDIAFYDDVLKAEAKAEESMVAVVHDSAVAGDPASARWWLERRRPDEWSRKVSIDIMVRQHAEQLAAQFGLPIDDVMRDIGPFLNPSPQRALNAG